MLWWLAARNFRRHWRRFAVVLVALALGFAAVVVLLGITGGMSQTLRAKASRYFAGDLTVISFAADRLIADQTEVIQALRAMPAFASLTRRTEYFGGDGTLFFAGMSVRQRKFVGVDWVAEGENFRKLDFVEGGVPAATDPKGLLISEATAERLGARTGDDVTAVFNTNAGQRNSLELIVRGVYRDTSLFGYASYIDLGALNPALGYPEGSVTGLGAVLKPGFDLDLAGEQLREMLAKVAPTYATIHTRQEQALAFSQGGAGAQIAVMTLGANLAQIDDILYSLLVVASISTLVFLAIVVIGVGNTYRMVVFERTRELGTLRALGLSRARLVALIASEAGWLALCGAFVGGLFGLGLLGLAMLPQWSSSALAGLFLMDGRLVPALAPGAVFGAFGVLVAAALVGALGPALKAARQRPVDALRSHD